MAETLQDIQIEEYLLNQHDFDLISKYTNEGQLDRALAKPIASVKQEINFLTQPQPQVGQQMTGTFGTSMGGMETGVHETGTFMYSKTSAG